MPDALTTTTQVDPAVAVFYDRILLKRGLPYEVHDTWAQVRNLDAKSGNTIKFRRYSALSLALTPLPQGRKPPGQALSKTDLTAKVSQFGDWVHITDMVDLTVEDKVLTEAAEVLGEQRGQTRDVLLRNILTACASVTDATEGSNSETPTEITKKDIQKVVKTLLGGNAQYISNVKKAGSGQGTMPIRPSFGGIFHTDLMDDIEDVDGFIHTANYPRQENIMEAEYGSTGQVRWLMTNLAHKDEDASPDEYKCLICGKNAYGTTTIEQGNVKNIVKGFDSGGVANPLNQSASSGWKMIFTARILNDAFMHVLNVTHSSASG
ncbi:MAG: N4-gp56 family major capsid protein [Desulfobacteraceae bacterium]